ALSPDQAQRFRIVGVDLDPEHVEVLDRAQNLQIAFGLGVEIEVEQDIHVRSGAVADRFEMHAQVAQHLALDIDLRLERRAEAGTPAGRLAVVIGEDVGLQRGEFFLAHLAPDRLDTVEALDRRLVPGGMIDAPGRAMRPVDANAVADLAAEQFIAGYAEKFRLGVKEGVFDRADGQRYDAARGGPRRGVELGIDPLVLEGVLADHPRRQTLDCRAETGCAKTFVIFTPTDYAVLRRDLDEMIIPPAGVAGEDFEVGHL